MTDEKKIDSPNARRDGLAAIIRYHTGATAIDGYAAAQAVIDAVNSAPTQGADARPVAMTNGSFHCPACCEAMKGPLACGHCLWQKPEAVDAEIGADGIATRNTTPSVGAISDADKSDLEWLDLSERIKAETPNIFGGYMKFIGNFARAVLATRDATPVDSAQPKCRICGHKWHCGQCVNLHPDREPKS